MSTMPWDYENSCPTQNSNTLSIMSKTCLLLLPDHKQFHKSHKYNLFIFKSHFKNAMSISYLILMSYPIKHDLYNAILNYTRPSTLALKQFFQYSNIYHHINSLCKYQLNMCIGNKTCKNSTVYLCIYG